MAELRKYECIVPLSGGKDSQACLKMAVKEFGPSNVLALFCDTQFEHPITYQHIKNTVKLCGVDLHTVTGGSVEEKILKYGRFPGGGRDTAQTSLKFARLGYF